MIGNQNRKQVRRLAACAALLALSVTPTVASGRPAMAQSTVTAATTASAVSGPASVTLTSITPAVAFPRVAVTITGTIRNTGSIRIDAPMVRALIGDRGLTSRAAVSDWATPAGKQPLAEVARTPLGPSLAPGAVATFTLIVPASAISHLESFAVLPVNVDVVGTSPAATGQDGALGSQHTFLPTLSSFKEYEPISIAWLVPLALDPDPALHGMDSAARDAAWTKAIGAGSRLDRVITGTDSTKVTWAIDPAVLGPPAVLPAGEPSATPSPTAGPTPDPSTSPAQGGVTGTGPVTEAATALASRLRAAAPRHTLWSFPYTDPDLVALLPLVSGNRAVREMINHPSALDAAVGPTRTGIAWPVDGRLTTAREGQLRAAYSVSGLAAAVISASTLSNHTGFTDNASRKSTGGLPLLAYDQALSRTFGQTSAAASGAITIQQFLADTMALLGERPGTPNRSVMVAAPRMFAGDPSVLASYFAAIAQAPWLTPTSTDLLLAAAGAAAPEALPAGTNVTPRTPTSSPSASKSAPDTLSPGTSPLSQASLRQISRTTSAIEGVAGISNDAQQFKVRWTDAQEQLLSSRWRGHKVGFGALDAATQAAITSVSRQVHVVPSSVNFFADRGVLQITVVNDLAVPVHDVRLTLIPGQPRLRIDQQPGPLRIGAKSRANVHVHVTAIAAGLVPVEAVLRTANGTSLGPHARVNVRVQPTSTWIYWVLGGLAGIILVLGIYRSVRRGSSRAPRHTAQELSVNV
ncbi:MAG TPA: DUF6049 family protein [Dermatophilaceae bacterium]